MIPLFAAPTELVATHVRNRWRARDCTCHRSTNIKASSLTDQSLVRIRENVPAVLVKGADRFSFINGMGTNAFSEDITHPVQSVFTSNIGRCFDLITALQIDEQVLVLSSLEAGQLFQYLDRFLFPADNVKLTSVLIPKAVDIMAMYAENTDAPSDFIVLPTIYGATMFNRSVLTDDKATHDVSLQWISSLGEIADETQWEERRICEGIPKMGVDITSENNPLEAGLWSHVSFEKGCYIGQETIARLNTYDGVKQILCGMEFDGRVDPGQKISSQGKDAIGAITSSCQYGDRYRAIGYIRKKSGLFKPSSRISAGTADGVITETPRLKQGYENRSPLKL